MVPPSRPHAAEPNVHQGDYCHREQLLGYRAMAALDPPLPPPPLDAHEWACHPTTAPARNPLPWVTILGGAIGMALAYCAWHVRMAVMSNFTWNEAGLWLPAYGLGGSVARRCLMPAVVGALFALSLCVSERLLGQRPRLVSWSLGGAATGLVAQAALLGAKPWLLRGVVVGPGSTLLAGLAFLVLVPVASWTTTALWFAWLARSSTGSCPPVARLAEPPWRRPRPGMRQAVTRLPWCHLAGRQFRPEVPDRRPDSSSDSPLALGTVRRLRPSPATPPPSAEGRCTPGQPRRPLSR